jgi:hypothetical protein
MAGAGCIWTRTLAAAALLAGARVLILAQSVPQDQIEETGSLAGKLTDLYSKPLEGVTVILRNQATGKEAQTISMKNGAYRFSNLEPGEYEVEANSPTLGRGQVEEIVVAGGHEARVQTAIAFESPTANGPVMAASREPDPPKAEAHVTTPLPPVELPAPTVSKPALTVASPQAVARLSAPATAVPVAAGQIVSGGGHRTLMLVAIDTALAAAQQIAQARYRPVLAAAQQSALPVGASMSATELQALPVRGRHWQDFVLDSAPTSAAPAGGQAEISLRGAGSESVSTAVDGIGRELAFGSTNPSGEGSFGEEPAGIAQVGAGGHGFAVSEAAVRAVETATGNLEAEAARAAGGRINVETQRGSESLHGQGFIFDRQNNWGAQNPLAQIIQETAPATVTATPVFTSVPYTPTDRETTWGLGAGSRILRNKLFWFAALDGAERNDPGVSTVKHPDEFFAQPSNDQMQELCARLGYTVQGPPGTQPYCPTAEVTTAYSKMLETLDSLLGLAPRTSMQWTGFGRIDWQASERNHLTLEATGADWNAAGGGLTRVSETYGNHSFGSTKANEEWLLGRWEAFLTPNLLIVSQTSAGGDLEEAPPETPSAFEQTLLPVNAWGQLPQIVVDNRYGFTIGNPSRFGAGSYPDERSYQTQELVDWVHSKLLVKAGFDLSHNFDATSLLRNQTGSYVYSSVENFISDALVFQQFGLSGELDPTNQHNCDQTGKVWRDSSDNLRGLGSLPCYSDYSQTIGPADWHLSTNEWAGYGSAQWQPGRLLVFSAGLRWEREQLPPPIASLSNPGLPLTQKLPSLGNSWAPRLGLAVGSGESHWPLLRLGYGIYFGRTQNSAIETALTQTGSLNGDLNFFITPQDGFNPSTGTSDAPPFPYVLQGDPASVIKPGAVEFAPAFHNPEVHQGIASIEERLPGHIEITASAMASLGRLLPVSIDSNLASASFQTITYAVKDATGAGPIKAAEITVPFYALWNSPAGTVGRPNPNYQQITQIMSRANSTYEAGTVKISRSSHRGLSLNAHYTYAHAMDWNPNESSQVAGNDVLDPYDFGLEYGTSNLDMRHSAGVTAIYETPWKMRGMAGRIGNSWMLSGVGHYRGGMPFTMRTSGSLAEEFLSTINGTESIVALGPGMNGSGGDNRVYGQGSDGHEYNIGRNTHRYPATWKADLRLSKRFDLGSMRQLELLAESFNLLNHQNVTEVETTGYTIEPGTEGELPTLNFLTGLKANTTAFGRPLNANATNFYRERQFQFGLRMRF